MVKRNPYRGKAMAPMEAYPMMGWIGHWVRTGTPDGIVLVITLTQEGAEAIAAIGGQTWLRNWMSAIVDNEPIVCTEIQLEGTTLIVTVPGHSEAEVLLMADERILLESRRE